MGVAGEMMRFGNAAFRHFRSLLLPRQSLGSFPPDQPSCGVKQAAEKQLEFPDKPKRPLTPYFRFMLKIRPIIQQKNPHAKPSDIVKLAAVEWEKADPSVRDELHQKYHEEMMQYTEKYSHYQNNLTDEQRQALQEAKEQKQQEKHKKMIQKKMQDMGKPKRPVTGFVRFMNDKSPERGDMPFKEWQRKIADDWKQLPENEKEYYTKKSQTAITDYYERLQEWEERMIRLGHIDIVRKEALIEPPDSSRRRLSRQTLKKE